MKPRKFYVVNHRDTHDDDFFKYSDIGLIDTTMHGAWKKFIALAGGERATWNKRGYIAVAIEVRVSVISRD